MQFTDISELPYAYTGSVATGIIRHTPHDFLVDEELSFSLDGEGEHVYLQIEKRDTNTAWLVRAIARHAGVKNIDIGYAGLKDKRAITRQWFSVYLPSHKQPDWQALESEHIKILNCTRHKAKLRRGALRANHFSLTVRDVDVEPVRLEERISTIIREGVPNYFTEQRFGRDSANVQHACELFNGQRKVKDRQKRGLLYSAARAWLFNQLLASRVRDRTWNRAVPGDIMMLAGSKRYFTITDEPLDVLQRRIDEGDIHPAGVLWGKGELETTLDAKQRELQLATGNATLARGLERAGLKQARRSLRVLPSNMEYKYDKHSAVLSLHFALESGAYATALLRELVDYSVAVAAKA